MTPTNTSGVAGRRVLALFALVAVLAGCAPAEPEPTYRTPPPMKPAAQIAVVGDSFTGGSGAGGVGNAGWPQLAWKALDGIGDDVKPHVTALSGAGYVTLGQAHKSLAQAVPQAVVPNDQVVVFFGGLNDGVVDAPEVGAAALAAFQNARRIAPKARMLVIGPAWPHPNPPPVMLEVRDAIKAAALQVGADFLDPISDGWFADTPPDFIGPDGTHPTDAGHAYMAQEIEPAIAGEIREIQSSR